MAVSTNATNMKQIRRLALKMAAAISDLEAKLEAQANMNTAQLKLINSILANIEENGN